MSIQSPLPRLNLWSLSHHFLLTVHQEDVGHPTVLAHPAFPLLTTSSPSLVHHPAPPANLQVIRPVGNNALLLGWDLPEMDLHGQSQGLVVAGYQLFVDGIAREKVKPLESKVKSSCHVNGYFQKMADYNMFVGL